MKRCLHSEEDKSIDEWNGLERFAEIAASHALVPENAFKERDRLPSDWAELIGIFNQHGDWRRRFKITPLAMATRLRESGLMSRERYSLWKREWDDYVATLPAQGKGFATPVAKALGRNGRPYIQLVLEALSANRLTPVTAARYLDLKFEHFDKLKTADTERLCCFLR